VTPGDPLNPFDQDWLDFLNRPGLSQPLDMLMTAASDGRLLVPLLVVIALLLAVRSQHRWAAAVLILVAAGAAEFVPVASVTNLARTIDMLKERGIWVVGTDGEAGQTLYAADLKRPLALVLGAEGEGMRRLTRERCDFLVRIPMAGCVESLNVSVAAGVALFEARRQRAGSPVG